MNITKALSEQLSSPKVKQAVFGYNILSAQTLSLKVHHV